jgi:large subunit ribosomal protein L15
MQLHELKAPKGARTRKRIVGRGPGSGRGKTSGRGEKGQKSRSGRGIMRGYEGGQMSLIRRLPKVGFRRKNPTVYQVVKLENLGKYKEGSIVDPQALVDQGLIKNVFTPFKILGNGELKKALTLKAHSFSKAAEEKIKKAGGKIEIINKQIVKEQLNQDKKDKTKKA